MRKHQCMHCAEAKVVWKHAPADEAIVQYTNGIVDFQQDHCNRVRLCVTGCPFNIPEVHSVSPSGYATSVPCARTRVQQGLNLLASKSCPTGLPALWHQARP